MSDNTPAVRRDPVPASYQEAMSVGAVLAKSGYFTDSRDEAQAAAKVIAGMELGIGPMAAMSGIYIVKGKVTLGANLIAGQVKRSGRYDFRVTRLDDTGCVIDFYQDGEKIGESSFTDADAKAAGLWGGTGPWKQHPRNMLYARAMSNGAKWFTPDIFAGPVYTPDELGAQIDGETGEVIDINPPPPPVDPTAELIRSRVAELRGEQTNEFLGRVMHDAGIASADLVDDAVYQRAKAAMAAAVKTQNDAHAAAAQETAADEVEVISAPQMRALHAKGREVGIDHDTIKALAHEVCGVDSTKLIPRDRMQDMMDAIEGQVVG